MSKGYQQEKLVVHRVIGVELPVSYVNRLQELADGRGISRDEVIEEAVRRYLAGPAKQVNP